MASENDVKTPIQRLADFVTETAESVTRAFSKHAPDAQKLIEDVTRELETHQQTVSRRAEEIKERYKRGARRTPGQII